MDSKKKITISWSGGKDAAFALYHIVQTGMYDVVHLHTVFDSETRRVGLHGVHESLIEAQAQALGLPLRKLYLKASTSHDAYTSLMKAFYEECALELDGVVFGDIFLEDLKSYRESLLEGLSLEPLYPLWGQNTSSLVSSFIDLGFKSHICAADGSYFDRGVAGRLIDHSFTETLPHGVDPCGENGEYHSIVVDGPMFHQPLSIYAGEVVRKEYRYGVKDATGQAQEVVKHFWFQSFHL